MKRHFEKRPQTTKDRLIAGAILLALGLFVTIQGFRAYNSRGGYDTTINAYADHNDGGLIGVAIGVALLTAAAYQLAVAAIREGRAVDSPDQAGH